MLWRGESTRKRLLLLVGVFGAGALLLGGFSAPVGATNNNVSAVICGGDAPGAGIDVTQPNDDSIVTQPTTTFRGTVSNATQIEVTIDGQYAATLAVGINQATFAIDLTLSEGTHTATFTANDVCLAANASDSVVVTYQVVTEPSDGSSVPTDVGDGTVIGSTGEDADTEPVSEKGWPRSIPVIGEVVDDFISDVTRKAGIDTAFKTSNPTIGTIRVGLTVVALSAVVMAGSVAPLVIQASPGLWVIFGTTRQASRRIVTWSLRAGGVLLMAVAYFI